MEFLKNSLELVSSPIGVMIIAMVTGGVLSFRNGREHAARRLLVAGTGLFLVYTFSPLAEVAVNGLERNYPAVVDPRALGGIRWVVVLSGYGRDDPMIPITSSLSDPTVCCVTEGIRLYRALPGSRVLISGGVPRKAERPVAAMMADLMTTLGVHAQDITLEGASQNTFENLREVAKIIGRERFVLVAAGCDLPRAVGVARRLGLEPVPAPACIWTLLSYPPGMSMREWAWKLVEALTTPSLSRLPRLQWAYHEYLGLAWYRLLGRI